ICYRSFVSPSHDRPSSFSVPASMDDELPITERRDAFLARALARNDAPPLAPALEARGLGHYRGYAEMLSEIDRLGAQGFEVHRIGRTVEGEPLLALHLGHKPRGTLARTTVVLSGVHPMEWIGIETHVRLLQRLARADLRDRALVAIPIVNPDGMRRVDRALRARRRRFIRHNARGVDLNRNFDARWGRLGIMPRCF